MTVLARRTVGSQQILSVDADPTGEVVPQGSLALGADGTLWISQGAGTFTQITGGSPGPGYYPGVADYASLPTGVNDGSIATLLTGETLAFNDPTWEYTDVGLQTFTNMQALSLNLADGCRCTVGDWIYRWESAATSWVPDPVYRGTCTVLARFNGTEANFTGTGLTAVVSGGSAAPVFTGTVVRFAGGGSTGNAYAVHTNTGAAWNSATKFYTRARVATVGTPANPTSSFILTYISNGSRGCGVVTPGNTNILNHCEYTISGGPNTSDITRAYRANNTTAVAESWVELFSDGTLVTSRVNGATFATYRHSAGGTSSSAQEIAAGATFAGANSGRTIELRNILFTTWV